MSQKLSSILVKAVEQGNSKKVERMIRQGALELLSKRDYYRALKKVYCSSDTETRFKSMKALIQEPSLYAKYHVSRLGTHLK